METRDSAALQLGCKIVAFFYHASVTHCIRRLIRCSPSQRSSKRWGSALPKPDSGEYRAEPAMCDNLGYYISPAHLPDLSVLLEACSSSSYCTPRGEVLHVTCTPSSLLGEAMSLLHRIMAKRIVNRKSRTSHLPRNVPPLVAERSRALPLQETGAHTRHSSRISVVGMRYRCAMSTLL